MNTPWQPIHTFNGSMFSIMSNGIPDSAEVVKYKGNVPAWAAFCMPLPPVPEELRDTPFVPHEQNADQHEWVIDEKSEQQVTTVGSICNYYGRLNVKREGDKFFWSIEDWDGLDWEEIPAPLYHALLGFESIRVTPKTPVDK